MDPKLISNYAFLTYWRNFNWDLYIRIIKAKMIKLDQLNLHNSKK